MLYFSAFIVQFSMKQRELTTTLKKKKKSFSLFRVGSFYLPQPRKSSDDVFTLDVDEGKLLVTNLGLPAEQQSLGHHLLRHLLSELQQLPADPWRVRLLRGGQSRSLLAVPLTRLTLAFCLPPLVHQDPQQAPGLTASHLQPQAEGLSFSRRGALWLQKETL